MYSITQIVVYKPLAYLFGGTVWRLAGQATIIGFGDNKDAVSERFFMCLEISQLGAVSDDSVGSDDNVVASITGCILKYASTVYQDLAWP